MRNTRNFRWQIVLTNQSCSSNFKELWGRPSTCCVWHRVLYILCVHAYVCVDISRRSAPGWLYLQSQLRVAPRTGRTVLLPIRLGFLILNRREFSFLSIICLLLISNVFWITRSYMSSLVYRAMFKSALCEWTGTIEKEMKHESWTVIIVIHTRHGGNDPWSVLYSFPFLTTITA